MKTSNTNPLSAAPAATDAKVQKPAEFLRELFLSRKERNPSYSQSALARDLGVSVAILSRVMSGQREMSLKFGLQVTTSLGLTERESNALLYSVLKNSKEKAKISARTRHRLENDFQAQASLDATGPVYTTVEIERFKAMSQWYHLAILNLTSVEGFEANASWISRALGITPAEANDGIQRLISIGLLSETDEKLTRTKNHLFVKTQKSEAAIRKFHGQMIEKASIELNTTDDTRFQNRLINGITFSCGPDHLEAIKDRIDQCQDEILAISSTGKKTAVYQMNAQLFPLTSLKNQPNQE